MVAAPPWYLPPSHLAGGLATSPTTYHLMGCRLGCVPAWAAAAQKQARTAGEAGDEARRLLSHLPILRNTLAPPRRPPPPPLATSLLPGVKLTLLSRPQAAVKPVPYAELITAATVARAAHHYGHGFAYMMLHAPWADARMRRLGGWLKPGRLTVEQLQRIVPAAKEAKLKEYVAPLNAMFDEFRIDTPYRIAAFLGNAVVESDHLKTFTEYATGEAYEGRADLGNTQPGDGRKFKGRGIIQVTGRTNYTKCGTALGVNLIATPEQLASDVSLAIRSGGWYWTTFKNLNRFADRGPDGFAETVYRVNGAVTAPRTHWDERVKYYKRALKELGAPVPLTVTTDHSALHKKK